MNQNQMWLQALLGIGFEMVALWPAYGTPQDNLFESTRYSGRGGAGVASYDSNAASRFNPASMTERNIAFQLRPVEFEAFYGTNGVNKIGELAGDNEIVQTAQSLIGTNVNGRAELGLLSMRFGSFEVSPFVVADGIGDFRNPALPEVYYKVDVVGGMNLSYSWNFTKQVLIGVTMRPFNRWYVSDQLTVIDVLDRDSLSSEIPIRSGFGLGADLGTVWSPDKDFRVAMAILNIGDAGYFQDTGSEPPVIQQKVNVGVLKRFELFGGHLDSFVDGQGIVNRGGVNLTRLVHIGFEQGWCVYGKKVCDHDFGFLLGVNEGYGTAGFFADLFIARLELASYSVELGETPGQRPDQRFAVSLTSSLTF